jgi:Tfp pilus assembly protein PilF
MAGLLIKLADVGQTVFNNRIACIPRSVHSSLQSRVFAAALVLVVAHLLLQADRAPAQDSVSATSDSAPLDRAQALSQGGAQAESERLLFEYLKNDARSKRAHALLGLVKYREGHPDKSLEEYSLAAKSGRLEADDLRIVALDYVQLQDLPAAERWLKASIARDATDWRTWRYLGGVEYSEEHPVEAANAFEECLRLDPENALAEDGLARSHEAVGQTEKAGEEYRLAILQNGRSASPSSLPLMHYGSYLRRTTSHLAEAIGYLKQAEQLGNNDWEAHAELGKAYDDSGDLKSSQAEVQTALALAPDRMRLHITLGRIYQREGLKDKAATEIKLYQDFASKHSKNRDLLDK